MPALTADSVSSSNWRQDAARIVEELFQSTPAESWDLLLDLRGNLLRGENWARTLDLFLACREDLEADHYLPFYRLRRLLSVSLRLESVNGAASTESLEALLRSRIRSFSDLKRKVRREVFEHSLEQNGPLGLRVVECGS